jgi:hypothetical protein
MQLADTRDSFLSVEAAEAHAQILKLINTLPPNQKRVLKLRFGFGAKERTLVEIGQHMGISKQRVHQLTKRALQNLRHVHVRHVHVAIRKVVVRDKGANLSSARRLALGIQGRYIGLLRNFSPEEKVKVKALAKAKGMAIAVTAMECPLSPQEHLGCSQAQVHVTLSRIRRKQPGLLPPKQMQVKPPPETHWCIIYNKQRPGNGDKCCRVREALEKQYPAIQRWLGDRMETYRSRCPDCHARYVWTGYKTGVGRTSTQLEQMHRDQTICRECGSPRLRTGLANASNGGDTSPPVAQSVEKAPKVLDKPAQTVVQPASLEKKMTDQWIDKMRVPVPLLKAILNKNPKEDALFTYVSAGGNTIQATVHVPDGGKNGLTVPVVDFEVNPGAD